MNYEFEPFQIGKFPITQTRAPSLREEASGVSEKIEAALEYTKKGFPVIPIAADSKKPLVAWKEYQKRKPTENEVKSFCKRYPNADIGIVTGKRHNLFVLDCDSQEAYESLQALLPDSLTLPVVKTPRGYHLYFSYPKNIDLTVGVNIMPGVDYRGDGGYVIAPPSKKGAYKWIVDLNTERPALPDAIIKKIYSTMYDGNEKSGGANNQKYLTEGRRDNDIFHAGNCLIKGGCEPEFASRILEILAKNSTPPFPEKEVIAKIESALKRADRKKIGLIQSEPFNFKMAAALLQQAPEKPDQILKDVIDAGDKMAFIGTAKSWKSFFLLQCLICIACGRNFLTWETQKSRRVLYIQFEIREIHIHRRLINVCRAINVTPNDLKDNLLILSARGLGITGREGIERIIQSLDGFMPEVIAFDPLYKISQGAENAAEDMKVTLAYFDELAEKTGAAIFYVHHDPKGSAGDRDIRDRGAGSNVTARDYDACITLTAHAKNQDAAVVDVLLRNYPPQEPFAVAWTIEDGYCFKLANDILPEKKTSRTKPEAIPLSLYLPVAFNVLGDEEMEIGTFKIMFKEKSCLSDQKIRDFLHWATAGGAPQHLITREIRGRGLYKKYIRKGDV